MALWLFLLHCRNYLPLGHCEYQSTCIRLSCPATVLSSSQPWSLHECLPFSVLLSSALGLVVWLSCLAWQCHNSKSVSSPNHQTIQGKKRNCPHIICAHVLFLPRQFCHCRMGCCHMLCRALSVLLQVYFRVICVSSQVTKLKILMPKRLRFFGMDWLKITLPLKETITLSIASLLEGL